jgi:hypothetical protein
MTYGPAVARVAEALGTPLLPWQAQVNAVACEVNESGTGWRYPTIICTVPRQAGKTTWLGALMAHRSMQFAQQRHWMTAQTGMAAADSWREWNDRAVRAFPGRFRSRAAQGAETLTFEATGSSLRVFPPLPRSLHGRQGDTVALDECWAWTPEQGEALLQAVVPTQATRPWRQLLLISTAGADDSVWWKGWVDKGRAAVDDPASRIAFFEWSAPDGVDLTDPQVWAEFHPAYGSLIDRDAMNTALEQFGLDGFARAYGNRWPPADVSWRAGWPGCVSLADVIPPTTVPVLAVDATPDHRSASIVAAAIVGDRLAVELIDARPGVDWVKARVVELSKRHRAEVVIQRAGPLGYIVEEATRAGARIIPASSEDYGDAVARLKTLITEGRLAHTDDPRLNAAVDAAVGMRRGDREVWARRDVTADISPIVAASFAVWRAATPKARPMVVGL